MSESAPTWRPFERVPNAKAIAAALDTIPPYIALTPLRDKRPYRPDWNHEPAVDREILQYGLLYGSLYISERTGNPYRMFDSGFGIRTGEISGGVLAIDVDGEQADALLQAISGGDIPPTWKWSSGKPGRYQIAFQMPDDLRPSLPNFQRHVLREWNGVSSTQDLDFRYNGHQSCLPPSRHPDTGAYFWIQSPSQTPLAIAPQWLIDLLLSFVNSSNSNSGTTNQNVHIRISDSARTPCGCGNHDRRNVSESDLSKLVSEITGRLTIEQVYNWGGHSWSQGNGKLLGFCPQHGGKSGTAFQVDLTTGEWYCHGCNTGGHAIQYRWFLLGYTGTPTGRDFIDILQQLAWEAGSALPEWRPQGEPDPEAYAEYIRWEQEQEAIAQVQAEADYLKWIQDLYKKLAKKTAKRNRSLKRSGYSDEQIAALPPVTLNQELVYSPGEPLPTPEQYRELGSPKIIFKEGDRQSLLRDLIALCFQKGMESSHTGAGKTEDVCRWNHKDFDAYRLWLFTENSRLPQTASQEQKFTPMPVRHDGMVVDDHRLTPLGEPVTRWPKNGGTANVAPNCYRAPLFHAIAEKGYSIDGDKAGEQNPICKTCRFSGGCAGASGAGFGFRNERKEVLAEVKTEEGNFAVYPHISLNPLSSLNSDSYSYSNDVGVWDEWTRILRVTRTLTASLSDIDRVWGELESNAPHLFSQLTDFRLALRAILTAEKPPYYGWNFAELIGKLPLPENILDIIMELSGMSPDWLDIFSEDSVNMDSVELEGMSVAEHKQLKRQLASTRQLLRKEPFDKVRELPVNWLLATLKVLFNVVAGSLGIQWGKLTITLRDGRLPGVAQALKFNLFMDATGSRADLALALGVEEHTIAHIEQAAPSYSNLTIVQVNGFDTASNQRSESTDIRITVAKAKLRELHPDIAVIDHLCKLLEGDDAHHFGNLVRGSNIFSDRSAIASFGLPAPNMGALLHYYLTIMGKCLAIDNPEFEKFYQRRVEAEIIQEVGRLRAQRRPSEQVYFYLCADIEPEFLSVAFPGCRVTQIDAFNISPDAATPKEQTRWAILQAFKAIAESGGQLLTTAVANVVGITQGRLSQIAGEFGGWARLKRLLASLYKQLYRAANNCQNDANSLEPDDLWIAQTYLPLVVDDWLQAIPTASEVVALFKIPGWRTFERMIREMPVVAVAKLLGVFGGMLAAGGLEVAIDPDGG